MFVMLYVLYNLKQTITIYKNLNKIRTKNTENQPQKKFMYLKMFFKIQL